MTDDDKVVWISIAVICVIMLGLMPFSLTFWYKLIKEPRTSFEMQNLWLDRANIGYLIVLFLFSKPHLFKRLIPNWALLFSALAWVLWAEYIPYQIHFPLFSCLAIVTMKRLGRPRITIPLLLWIPILNECAQIFIPSRVCDIKDMMFDSVAITFGVLYWWINKSPKLLK